MLTCGREFSVGSRECAGLSARGRCWSHHLRVHMEQTKVHARTRDMDVLGINTRAKVLERCTSPCRYFLLGKLD